MPVDENDEIERRKVVVAARETDVERWSRQESFSPQWAYRASLAAQMIPAYSQVLDIGAGAMDLEKALPEGCGYRPCDLVARDARTIVCDLNKGEFPQGVDADAVTMLGVLEYLTDPLDVLRKVRTLNRPFVCSYSITDRRPQMDRASQGWINSFDFATLEGLMRQAGFRLQHRQLIDPLQDVFKWVPDDPVRWATPALKKVAVISYFNDPNFGDRLGYHVINGLMPAHAVVTHASTLPWSLPPDETYDLVVLGIGNSLNAPTVIRPELQRLVATTPTIGLFGTQYRHMYRDGIDPKLFDALLSNLATWWARYEEDIRAFGRGRSNVRHMGDLLISAFPMARPTIDRSIYIPPDFRTQNALLDRVIQQIQSYRQVRSARIHPMLCALTSADQVAYIEQREQEAGAVSGKFRSQLYDVFGRTFEENKFFDVDRDAVVRYKVMVEANLAELKAEIVKRLA